MLLIALTMRGYVSVINDLTDFRDDQASGKRTGSLKVAERSSQRFSMLHLSGTERQSTAQRAYNYYAVPGVLDRPLYSLPPVRPKKRGVFGLLADASGQIYSPLSWQSLLYTAGMWGRWINSGLHWWRFGH